MVTGFIVIFVCTAATVYALVSRDHSDNIWIVYGGALAFATGRAGVNAYQMSKNGNGNGHKP